MPRALNRWGVLLAMTLAAGGRGRGAPGRDDLSRSSCRPRKAPRILLAKRARVWATLIRERSGGRLAVDPFPGCDAFVARSGAGVRCFARPDLRARGGFHARVVGAGDAVERAFAAVARTGRRELEALIDGG